MTRISNCRSCGSTNLIQVLDLGRTPLANSLVSPENADSSEAVYPLEVCFCQACALCQLCESVPPDQLFSDYAYFSSFSDTMLKHAEKLATSLTAKLRLSSESLVIEVASNDGYLLQYYKNDSVPVLGIEPAKNVAKVAQVNGIETLCEFFGLEVARELAASGKKADVIHANNVLAHVPDLNGVVAGLHAVLKQDGIAIVEVPYVRDLLENTEFDTIYHEHLSYFSLTALRNLFERNGLTIFDVEKLQIHGGSLRIYAARNNRAIESSVTEMLEAEDAYGLNTISAYEKFASDVLRLKEEVCSMLQSLKQKGHSIAAYGAAAKGSTLLNFMGIGTDILDFVCDRSTVKQGYNMPGVKLRILAPTALVEKKPDYVLLLTWNFAKEILDQQKEYLLNGGKFIIPIPSPTVVENMELLDDATILPHSASIPLRDIEFYGVKGRSNLKLR